MKPAESKGNDSFFFFAPNPPALVEEGRKVRYSPSLFRLALLVDPDQSTPAGAPSSAQQHEEWVLLSKSVDPVFLNKPQRMGRPMRQNNLSSKDLELGMVAVIHKLMVEHKAPFLRGPGRLYPFLDQRLKMDDVEQTPPVQFLVDNDTRHAFNVVSVFHPVHDVRNLQTFRIFEGTQKEVKAHMDQKQVEAARELDRVQETLLPATAFADSNNMVAKLLAQLQGMGKLSSDVSVGDLAKHNQELEQKRMKLASDTSALASTQLRVAARLQELNNRTKGAPTLNGPIQTLGGNYAAASQAVVRMDEKDWTRPAFVAPSGYQQQQQQQQQQPQQQPQPQPQLDVSKADEMESSGQAASGKKRRHGETLAGDKGAPTPQLQDVIANMLTAAAVSAPEPSVLQSQPSPQIKRPLSEFAKLGRSRAALRPSAAAAAAAMDTGKDGKDAKDVSAASAAMDTKSVVPPAKTATGRKVTMLPMLPTPPMQPVLPRVFTSSPAGDPLVKTTPIEPSSSSKGQRFNGGGLQQQQPLRRNRFLNM